MAANASARLAIAGLGVFDFGGWGNLIYQVGSWVDKALADTLFAKNVPYRKVLSFYVFMGSREVIGRSA